jgi:hypothetical protein
MPNFDDLYAPPKYLTADGQIENNDAEILKWRKKEEKNAITYLRAQHGWKEAETGMAVFFGEDLRRTPIGTSDVTIKKLRRQAREAVANAANINPTWKHKSHKDKYPQQALMFDKLRDNWWFTQDVATKLEETLQYAAGGSTGYLFLWPGIDPATNEFDILLKPLSWKQVQPFHAGQHANPDSVYGLQIWLEMPLPEAHAAFPEHIDVIKADRNSPSSFAKGFKKIQRRWRGVVDRMQNKTTAVDSPYPVADIFYTWIKDASINDTGNPVLMGEAGSHYSYVVPSLYDTNGEINRRASDGRILSSTDEGYAAATPLSIKDCKLFPNKRLMISTNYGVIYDGPPIWFNRFNPVVPFTFERVVGDFLGKNLISDGLKPEKAINDILRAIVDKIKGKQSPPVAIDNQVPVNIRRQLARNSRLLTGKTFEMDTRLAAKAIVPLLDADRYQVDAAEIEIVKYFQDIMDYLMGTNDSSFMSKLNQMPAADTQEAYLRSLGAIATSQFRGISSSVIKLAKVWLDFAPQVYTTERIITVLGADYGLLAMDFDPNTIVPNKSEYPDSPYESLFKGCSYAERLQRHIRNFSIYATSNSMQEELSQTNKLLLAQLLKMGLPISFRKLYDTFLKDGEYSITEEEYYREQLKKAGFAGILQKILQSANQEADQENNLAGHLADMVNGANQEGRPSSFQKPPTLEAKTNPDGTQRGTIASS